MKYFATAAALVSVVPGIVSLTMNTPSNVVQCQPELLTWSDGVAPYYLSVIPGGQPSATPLKSFDTTQGNSLTWMVDIPSGTSITFALKDNTGATAYTDMVNVQPNNDSSCLSGGAPPAPAPAPATPGGDNAPTPAVKAADATSVTGSASVRPGANLSATSAGRATSISPPTQTISRPVGTVASTPSPSRAATTSTSGAESRFNFGGFGFAGVLGLVGAVFLYF